MWPRSVSGLPQTLCERSHMLVGAKVSDLTENLLWFVCCLYVGILTSSLICQCCTSLSPIFPHVAYRIYEKLMSYVYFMCINPMSHATKPYVSSSNFKTWLWCHVDFSGRYPPLQAELLHRCQWLKSNGDYVWRVMHGAEMWRQGSESVQPGGVGSDVGPWMGGWADGGWRILILEYVAITATVKRDLEYFSPVVV